MYITFPSFYTLYVSTYHMHTLTWSHKWKFWCTHIPMSKILPDIHGNFDCYNRTEQNRTQQWCSKVFFAISIVYVGKCVFAYKFKHFWEPACMFVCINVCMHVCIHAYQKPKWDPISERERTSFVPRCVHFQLPLCMHVHVEYYLLLIVLQCTAMQWWLLVEFERKKMSISSVSRTKVGLYVEMK